jgi:hypothetical protein
VKGSGWERVREMQGWKESQKESGNENDSALSDTLK